MVNFKLIGSRIRQERKKANKTQEQLAEMLDVSEGYISQIERGVTKVSLDTLGTIAEFLNADIGKLVTGSAYETTEYLNDDFKQVFLMLNAKERELLTDIALAIVKNK